MEQKEIKGIDSIDAILDAMNADEAPAGTVRSLPWAELD